MAASAIAFSFGGGLQRGNINMLTPSLLVHDKSRTMNTYFATHARMFGSWAGFPDLKAKSESPQKNKVKKGWVIKTFYTFHRNRGSPPS